MTAPSAQQKPLMLETIRNAKGVSFSIPFGFFRQILSALLRRPYHLAQGQCGLQVRKDRVELLCRSFGILHEGDAYRTRRNGMKGLSYSLAFSTVPIGRPQVWRLLALSAWGDPLERPALQVLLGSGKETGLVTGLLHVGSYSLPLEALRIIGPGFHKIGTVDFPGDAALPLAEAERQRWSRMIGALGEHAWRTLTSLTYCIVGVDRLGSLIALSLAKAGVRRIALIDPDRLELHNLAAMDVVTEQDLGRFKVEAVQDRLSRDFSYSQIFSLPRSLLTPEGVDAAREADVIITCPGSDAPRLLAGALACLHLKVLLDISTSVFRRASDSLEISADIRLLLPGDGCMLCCGGVANGARALSQLCEERQEQRTWQEERAGSLRSLNHTAAHLGLTLLENLVAGRLTHSTWLRLQIDPHGVPSLQTFPLSGVNQCLLCAATGRGDLLAKEDGDEV